MSIAYPEKKGSYGEPNPYGNAKGYDTISPADEERMNNALDSVL